MPVASMAAAMGGNVRVGLEDSLWIGAGRMAESNAQQVRQVRKIIEGLGLEIATPDEAREILQLKARIRWHSDALRSGSRRAGTTLFAAVPGHRNSAAVIS